MMQGSNSVEDLLILSYWPHKYRAALKIWLLLTSGDTLQAYNTIHTRCSRLSAGESRRPGWRSRYHDQKDAGRRENLGTLFCHVWDITEIFFRKQYGVRRGRSIDRGCLGSILVARKKHIVKTNYMEAKAC